MTSPKKIEFEELLRLDRHKLHAILARAHPVDPARLDGLQYQGVDLSLPPFMNKLLWKTFRKTFIHDPAAGVTRGWNVRMEQVGIEGPQQPKRNKVGGVWTFAHYELRSATGKRFPWGWTGPFYLDYGDVGNVFGDSLAYTPLVAVNEGDMTLLLGWEVFKLGPLFVPLPDYWALRLEGPIDHIAEKLQ